MIAGIRVGAILSEDDKQINLLGYGIYVGDIIPEDAVGWMADILREENIKNPCIKLDSDQYVFGCECWWGSEAQIKSQVDEAIAKGKVLVQLDIDTVREKFANK